MTANAEIREALAMLPRADHHPPGRPVTLDEVYTVSSHRTALDPDRALVIGNRGMGKSFWAHALLNPEIRALAASRFRFPVLKSTEVVFGFNGSARIDPIAPPPDVLASAAQDVTPVTLWQAVMARAVANIVNVPLPERFAEAAAWVKQDAERFSQLLTRADDTLHSQGKRLLVLFDALDRLSSDWAVARQWIQGLMQLALATQSFRALRVKLFLRLDQFSDPRLFEFPDGSKVQSARVELSWQDSDLYALLFHRLQTCPAFVQIEAGVNRSFVGIEPLIKALAGEYMGSDRRRGHVVTWLPTHLADGLGQISPRTFLTAWREAASYGPCPAQTAVDHQGILEGVRKASADRLAELSQDYPWVRIALEPLRGQTVPLLQDALIELWRAAGTQQRVFQHAKAADRPILIASNAYYSTPESALLHALKFIGVVEVRKNSKVDVPDIFRVEARIKRRGGVKPPRRSSHTG